MRPSAIVPQRLVPGDGLYPEILLARLGEAAPASLDAVGPLTFLANRKTALFCSAKSPGDVILPAYDTARRLRDTGGTVISGFHSPIERECLEILLRGTQPVIICPARAAGTMRIPSGRRGAFDAGRVLFLFPFAKEPRRVTRDSAIRRNSIVAALADEAFVPHVSEGGETARILDALKGWNVPIRSHLTGASDQREETG
jgi:predicted Rossmann fold nucleotide-binding protein DprA/Smf involved in DNA uptake